MSREGDGQIAHRSIPTAPLALSTCYYRRLYLISYDCTQWICQRRHNKK